MIYAQHVFVFWCLAEKQHLGARTQHKEAYVYSINGSGCRPIAYLTYVTPGKTDKFNFPSKSLLDGLQHMVGTDGQGGECKQADLARLLHQCTTPHGQHGLHGQHTSAGAKEDAR